MIVYTYCVFVCNNRALFGGCGCVFVTFLIICFCVLSDVLYYIERVPTHREPVYRYVISKRIVNHSSCNIWCSCNEEVACACGGKLCQCLACVARRFTTTCQDCVFHVHDFKGSRYPSTTLREVGTRPRLSRCLWCLAGIAARSIIYLRVLAVRRTYM